MYKRQASDTRLKRIDVRIDGMGVTCVRAASRTWKVISPSSSVTSVGVSAREFGVPVVYVDACGNKVEAMECVRAMVNGDWMSMWRKRGETVVEFVSRIYGQPLTPVDFATLRYFDVQALVDTINAIAKEGSCA